MISRIRPGDEADSRGVATDVDGGLVQDHEGRGRGRECEEVESQMDRRRNDLDLDASQATREARTREGRIALRDERTGQLGSIARQDERGSMIALACEMEDGARGEPTTDEHTLGCVGRRVLRTPEQPR